jgi:hypothetical protein
MAYEIDENNIRVHAPTNMDSVEIRPLDYHAPGVRSELSVIMTAEAGHVYGAVPILDILKYVLLHNPELLQTARVQLDDAAEEQRAAALAKAEARHNEGQAFCDAFLEAFPSKPESSHLACDRSDTWMHMIDGAPTTGEGCIVNGMPVFDYYSQDYKMYELGVLKTVADWARARGMFGEAYDAGTLKFYPV